MLERGLAAIRGTGHSVVNAIWRLGYASRFFFAVLTHSGMSFRRFYLTVKEIYFAGVLSLIIILVSGLFVGMVLGLQGYETLQKYGSESALGTLVALSLVRELGPVLAALLFASRAGSAITAEIGLMKATEQISAMEMMAVDPIARVVAPRFAIAQPRFGLTGRGSHWHLQTAISAEWTTLIAPTGGVWR